MVNARPKDSRSCKIFWSMANAKVIDRIYILENILRNVKCKTFGYKILQSIFVEGKYEA